MTKPFMTSIPDLHQLGFVFRVLNGDLGGGGHPLVALSSHPLCNQHVVQPHQLWVGGVLHVLLVVVEARPLLDLAEDGEQGRLHPQFIHRHLPGVFHGHVALQDPVEEEVDVRVGVLHLLALWMGAHITLQKG